MLWHNIPDDYEESSDYNERDFKLEQEGNNTSYAEYQPVKQSVAKTTTTIDDDIRLFLANMEKEPIEPKIKTMTRPVSVEFNFKPRIDTSQETRNRLYIGRIETQTQTHLLWGFDTWQEFRDHIHAQDLAQARALYEEVAADMAVMFDRVGMFKIRLWTAREAEAPILGYWAVSIDSYDTQSRNIISFYNDRLYINANLSLAVVNKLFYNPKKWMER